MFCFKISNSFSLKFELWRHFSSAHRSALDISDIVSNLYSVPVSSGLDAVVCDDTQPSLLTPFISLSVPSLCLPSHTVKGSLSGWIRAGCPSRQRRPRDNAHCLSWVVNVTLCLQRLIKSNLNLFKAKSLLCSVLTVIECEVQLHSLVLFFQDLGSSDLRKDVYIVVHMIRIGRSYTTASLFYWAQHAF